MEVVEEEEVVILLYLEDQVVLVVVVEQEIVEDLFQEDVEFRVKEMQEELEKHNVKAELRVAVEEHLLLEETLVQLVIMQEQVELDQM